MFLKLSKCVYVFVQLYSSFYVYQVAKKLNGADRILMAMGYKVPSNRSSRDVDELKIEGEVDLDHVARTAADLVILQCDLKLLKGNAKAIGREYPSARIVDVLEARSMKEQTYRNTYEEAVARAVFRLNPNQHSSPNMRNRGQNAASNSNVDGLYFDSKIRPHPQAHATEQSSNNMLPRSTLHAVDGQNGNLLSRSAMGDQKNAGKHLIHRESAPLLDDTSGARNPGPPEDGSFISPGGSRRRLRKKSGSEGNLLDKGSIGSGGNMSSRAQMQREGLWRTEANSSMKRHTIGTMGSSIESREYTVGSPNDLEESFSIVSYTDRPPPNPDDLPEPVFQDETAVMNNEYQHHLRYSCSDSPCFDSRASIFVDKSVFGDDTFKPLQPMLPDAHRHGDYIDGGELRMSEDPYHDAHSGYPDRMHYGQTSPPKSPYSSGNRTASRTANSNSAISAPHQLPGGYSRSSCNSTDPGSRDVSSDGATSVPDQPPGGYSRSSYNSTNTGNQNATDNAISAPHRLPRGDSRFDSNLNDRSSDGNPSVGSQAASSDVQHQDNLPPPPSNMPATTKDAVEVPGSMERQDSSAPKYFESGIVGDNFVNIDLVQDGSPSSRKRSSHISETSRNEYEEKQKSSEATTKRSTSIAPKDSLQESNSESNLDVGKDLRQAQTSSPSGSWICDYCTFINSDTEECEVCGILRKKPY